METKKCAQCGQEKTIEDFSKDFPSLCKNCAVWNETQVKIRLAFDSYDSPQFIPSPRFIASVAAMQGLLATPTYYHIQSKDEKFIAEYAVRCADALLNELSKTKDENDN